MYSRRHSMPMHRGGLTGFGYGNSLGGLLLGGALKDFYVDGDIKGQRNERTDEDFALERARLDEINRKAAARRLANRQARIARGEVVRTVGVRNPRASGRNAHLKNMLKRLIDAEKMGAELERPEHPELAKYLDEDVLYNTALYDSNRYPKFYTDKFSKKYYGQNNYGELFPAAIVREALSEERKAAMKRGKEAAKGKQKFVYIDSRGNRKILTEGTKAFITAANTKRVQEDNSLLQPV